MSNVVMSNVGNGLRAAGASMALVIAIAGCASDTDTATDSAGDESIPVTVPASSDGEVLVLQIGTNDPADSPTAPAILEFAEQVDELSVGAIVVEPVWRAAGDPVPDDWDQVVAARVIDGSLDLGFVPAAAWDAVGVTSLRALNAPFLVDSEELVTAIVSDDVADSLMAGFDDVGVTGLALVPEGLRYVFSYSDALTTPEDFDGVTIRSPRSDTVYSLFVALGASADDPQGSEFDEQAADGVLAGAESSFGRAAAGLPGGPTVAVGNMALFPKVNAIVVNGATFTTMTETQQDVLRDAAVRTLDVMLADAASESATAAEYCAAGGTIVEASDEELDAFVEAAAPVYTELEQDPVTGDLIERIRTLELDASGPSPITPCAPADEATPSEAFDGDTIPEGTYQRTITTADGADLDPSIVAELLGPSGEKDTEFVIESDAWTLYEVFADGEREVLDVGTYSYDTDGRWVTVSTSGGCSGCVGGYDWTIDGDRLTLTLADVEDHSIYDDAVRLMTEGDYRGAASESSTLASGTTT